MSESQASQALELLPVAETSFPRFSSLPAEIRQMIWRKAAVPRIVSLQYVEGTKHACLRVWAGTAIDGPEMMGFFDLDNQSPTAKLDQGPEAFARFDSTAPLPELFLVCKESSEVARRMYTKCFGTKYTPPSPWFNFELDTLYLDWGYGFADVDGDDEDGDEELLFQFLPLDLSDDVKKIKTLAMYQGELPQGLRVGDYIDMTLERFGNVDNLTMVPPNSDREMSGLVFLELLEYTEYPEYNDDETFGQILHPAMADMFPNMEELFERTGMWSESEWLWKQRPYSKINRSREESGNARLGGGQKTWEEPHLQVKPIVTSKQKVEYLNSCLEFDRKRSAERVTITVAALGYNSLKFSLPLTTTLGELVSMFCRARGIVLDPVHNRAFIYTDIIGNINDCSWSDGAYIYSIADGEENTRVDMFFDPPRPSQLSCDCPNVTCSHTRKYQKLHYMENEDWGIRDMFKRLENGGL